MPHNHCMRLSVLSDFVLEHFHVTMASVLLACIMIMVFAVMPYTFDATSASMSDARDAAKLRGVDAHEACYGLAAGPGGNNAEYFRCISDECGGATGGYCVDTGMSLGGLAPDTGGLFG